MTLEDLDLDLVTDSYPYKHVFDPLLIERLHRGMYHTHFSFEYDCPGLVTNTYPHSGPHINDYETPEEWGVDYREWVEWANQHDYYDAFGTCDYPEQVVEHYPWLEWDDEHYILTFHKILRSEQPSYGGWRWHKNGHYIGTKKPRSEYLFHDKHIDEVWCYRVLEISTAYSRELVFND